MTSVQLHGARDSHAVNLAVSRTVELPATDFYQTIVLFIKPLNLLFESTKEHIFAFQNSITILTSICGTKLLYAQLKRHYFVSRVLPDASPGFVAAIVVGVNKLNVDTCT